MKKNTRWMNLAAFVVAGALLAGCAKEETVIGPREDVVVTVTTTVRMAPKETTKALADNGHKTFSAGDQIAVIYENTSGETVKAVSNELTDADITLSTDATFTVTLVNPKEGESEVSYVYPAAMANDDGSTASLASQDGTLATLASQFDYARNEVTAKMLVDGPIVTLPTDVALVNQLSVCELWIRDDRGTLDTVDDVDITSHVTDLTISDGTHTYTITRPGPFPMDEAIWVAMWPVANATLQFSVVSACVPYTKTTTQTISKNWKYEAHVIVGVVPPSALAGQFTVGMDGSTPRKVRFSRGNLLAFTPFASDGPETWNWTFAARQYDFVGTNSANHLVDGNGSISAPGTVDEFCFSTANTVYGIHNSTYNGDYSGAFKDWGYIFDGVYGSSNPADKPTWYTLSLAEWNYIFGGRNTEAGTAPTIGSIEDARFAKARLFGTTHGVIIFPDSYTHPSGIALPEGINDQYSTSWDGNNYTTAEWAQMEQAGCVFIPAAGHRLGTSVSKMNENCEYWGTDAWHSILIYSSQFQITNAGTNPEYGKTIRLVTSAN